MQNQAQPCGKLVGMSIGKLCEKCDGKCVTCDSLVNQQTKARICEECEAVTLKGRCILCHSPGFSDAFYCKECVIFENDRDGCPALASQAIAKRDIQFGRSAR